MKIISICTSAIVLLSIFTGSTNTNDSFKLSKKAQKRIDKVISKEWKKEEIKKKQVNVPDSVDMNLEFHSMKKAIYKLKCPSELVGILYIGRVKSCRMGGCESPNTDEQPTDHEHFDYMIIFDPHNLEVTRVEVIDYQATYGYEICSRGWLRQFNGYHGKEDLKYGKNIQAISGATISGITITIDIENVTKYMKSLKHHDYL